MADQDIEELRQRISGLEEENRQLKEELNEMKEALADKKSISENSKVSRRDFLKKIGAGALGIGALSLSPVASQLKITKNGIRSSNDLNLKGTSLGLDGNKIHYDEVSSTGTENVASYNGYASTVDTSDTQIYTGVTGGAFILVSGNQDGTTGGSSQTFLDMVMVPRTDNSPTVVQSFAVEGSPDSRTYSMSSNRIHLSMSANTYHVQVWGINMSHQN